MAPEDGIGAAEVRKIALLARLSLAESEVEPLTSDMRSILAYVKKLEAVAVGEVPATAHAAGHGAKLRPDVVQPGLSLEAALRNAPERLGDGFGVPKIIE